MGTGVGRSVGKGVGLGEGLADGVGVGCGVGRYVGRGDGLSLGLGDGSTVPFGNGGRGRELVKMYGLYAFWYPYGSWYPPGCPSSFLSSFRARNDGDPKAPWLCANRQPTTTENAHVGAIFISMSFLFLAVVCDDN